MGNDANVVEIPIPSIGPGTGVEDVNNKGNAFHAPKPTGALSGEQRPAGAKPDEKQPEKKPDDVPFHEHPRWKEVQSERKELRSEVQSLKQQLAKISMKSEPTAADVSKAKNLVSRLVQTSTMDETNAQAFVDELLSEVDNRTKQKISPLEEDYNVRVEQQARVKTADENWKAFKDDAGDIDEDVEKKMQSLFMKLTPDERQQVSLDKTHFGLKVLYRMAKDVAGDALPATPAAVPAAPKTGSVAGKGTSTPSTGFKFKMSEINAMPNSVFRQKEAEIKAAQVAGQIDVNN